MTMKTRKTMIAFLMATTMVSATAAPALAFELPVSIDTKVMNGSGIKSGTVDLEEGDTVLDALKKLYPNETETTKTIDGREYHYIGDISWYQTSYTFEGVNYTSNYIPAVKMTGHSQNNRFFGDNGVNSTDDIATNKSYRFLRELNQTEKALNLKENSTFNNTVHADNWLSEKDYNEYSGWMVLVNNSTDNSGVDTVLNENSGSVRLAFSMATGLDLGQTGYMKNASGVWTQVNPWATATN